MNFCLVSKALLFGAVWIFASGGSFGASPSRDYYIQPVPFTSVHVADGFWTPRMETNRVVTVWYDFKRCEETGRIDNFAKAAGLMKGEFRGIPFDDSDVYKVIEGASYSLALKTDPALDKYLDDLIAKIAAAQERDGYLYTARRLFTPEKMPRMSGPTRFCRLGGSHELYNVGHLYEAAVAHYMATGKRSLLDVALKNADFLCTVFGPGKLQEPPGHEEIEIGLAKLYRATGNEKYLKLAKFYIDIRGRAETHKLRGYNQQDHKPVVEQDEAIGHSVRAAYLYSGVADVAALTGDPAYIKAIDRIWENCVSKKLYLTGGIGARHKGEEFGDNYELPNKTAYNETCAAIANALWNHRMFMLHGDGKYLDVFERIIYNGFLSGVALTGDAFFYPNPLACDTSYKRSPWFGCACCPVNIVRFLPEMAGCIYAARENAAYVNLFIGGSGTVKLAKNSVKLSQVTRYPWDGHVKLTVEPEKRGEFTINVRIPGWAQNRPVPSDLYRYADTISEKPVLKINGKPVSLKIVHGFACLASNWKSGDTIELDLPMPVRRVVANDLVKDDAGLVAIERGPIVYCVEGADNGRETVALVLADNSQVTAEHRADLLGGVTVLRAQAQVVLKGDNGAVHTRPIAMTAIPYYAWCHRGPNPMAVWLARSPEAVQPLSPPTIASLSKCSASHAHQSDSVGALNDGVEPRNSGDHSVSRFTWWDHRGTTEWVQYDFKEPTKVSSVDVYWFDDTGRGSCRVPQCWKVLYRKDGKWEPVANSSGCSADKNKFNTARFDAVTTDALRLEVQLQPKFSGGILEWRVK